MTYSIEKCNCGHQACTDFHVWPIAACHGVGFTKEQATAVADLLNRMEPTGDRKTFTVPPGYTAEKINGRTSGWLIRHGTGELVHYSEVKS